MFHVVFTNEGFQFLYTAAIVSIAISVVIAATLEVVRFFNPEKKEDPNYDPAVEEIEFMDDTVIQNFRFGRYVSKVCIIDQLPITFKISNTITRHYGFILTADYIAFLKNPVGQLNLHYWNAADYKWDCMPFITGAIKNECLVFTGITQKCDFMGIYTSDGNFFYSDKNIVLFDNEVHHSYNPIKIFVEADTLRKSLNDDYSMSGKTRRLADLLYHPNRIYG